MISYLSYLSILSILSTWIKIFDIENATFHGKLNNHDHQQ